MQNAHHIKLKPGRCRATDILLRTLAFLLLPISSMAQLIVHENSARVLRFSIAIPAPHFSQQEVNGEYYDVVAVPGFIVQHHPGLPALPRKSFTILLPPTGIPELSFVAKPAAVFHDKRLSPSFITTIDREADSVSYAPGTPSAFFELPPAVRLADTAWWGGFRLGRVEILPCNVSGMALEFYSEVQVTLRYPDSPQSIMSPTAPLDTFEQKTLAPLLNFKVGKHWRASNPAMKKANVNWEIPADPTALKLETKSDGLFYVSFDDLAAAGWNVHVIDPATLQLFHLGEEVALQTYDDGDSLFETGEGLVFFGERKRAPDAFFDDYTDANVYWLVHSKTRGLRMPERRVATSGNHAPASYFLETRHFEEDELYYHGDNDAQLFATLAIPGENWVWKMLFGEESFKTDLLLLNVAAEAPACTLRARVRGVTVTPSNPDHHTQFWLNGNFVGEVFFDDNEEVIFEAAFPSSFLREGKNAFELRELADTGAPYDQIYFDWVEIRYWRQYVASDNFLAFRAPPNLSTAGAYYQITNLHNSEIELFDRKPLQRLLGFDLRQTAPEQFVVTFQDSARGDRDYFIATPEARQAPAAILSNQPSDWRANTHAADYILLTAREFLEAAERLASYRRQHDGLRVVVVAVEDVYDEFNYGMPHSEAIRSFLQFAYQHWQRPRPSMVCFFGDASWDAKQNAADSYKRNFVLSFGNPVSDSRLVCFDGEDDFLPEMITGRIPVENLEQAHAVIDKIISAEAAAPAEWSKDFIFLNGGVDSYEQGLFYDQAERLIQRHVSAPPIGGKPVRIYKTTPGRLIGELKPQIVAAIDQGAAMLTFLGHAGSQTWDLMMINADISELRNRGKYPFIASMTCHTARFATPNQTSFGEEFLRASEKGATAFWGTTGWGFIFQDRVLLDSLFTSISRDSVRVLGLATTLARIRLWEAYGSATNNVNSIDQYTLLGDPATRLSLPLRPDLVLSPTAVQITPESPTEQTPQIQIKILLRNLGLATRDSVRVNLTARNRNNNETLIIAQPTLPPIGFVDSLTVTWLNVAKRGEYLVRVEADAENVIAELDELNNTAERLIYFSPVSATLAAPLTAALLNQDRPTLAVYNPAATSANEQRIQFELDTEASFESVSKVVSPVLPPGEVLTNWQVPAPLADGIYFWRSRSIENGAASAWQAQWFGLATQSPFAGMRRIGEQLHDGHFENTMPVAEGVTLARDISRALHLQVQAAGHDDGNRCYLIVNFNLVNDDSRGHNLVAINPATQQMLAPPRAFDTFASSAAADSLAAFIENLPPRTIVLAGIQDDGSFRMTERAHRALESIGSQFTRQVALRDSWAIIGAKGMTIGAAAEAHKRAGSGEVAVTSTATPFFARGVYHTPEIGPAENWKQLVWQAEPASHVRLAISGRRNRLIAWETIAADIVGESYPLAGISAGQYPFLKISATLSDDDGLDSPHLAGYSVGFDQTSDFAIASELISFSADTVQEGDLLTISAKVFNFNLQDAEAAGARENVLIRFAHSDANAEQGSRTINLQTSSITYNASKEFSTAWNSAGYRGLVTIYVEIDPEHNLAEPFEFNNLAAKQILIKTDTQPPRLSVTVDGNVVMSGDYVAPQPHILCQIFDDSVLPIADTSFVSVYLNGQRQAYASAAGNLEFSNTSAGAARAEVAFRPRLDAGLHHIKFEVRDATQNIATDEIEVRVDAELHLHEVMNYPNPFANETEFTYYLTQPAQQVTIKIFTLAGRLIATFEHAPANAGFNRFAWNGRDADGDALANGVYFYKVIARADHATDEVVQKLVVMR
ncbi:T9SS type A sorting domain-containing protein [bacterium]|nr:T9SS type A sorting domain-containing protein [bacterium]